jgi:hypothetical protein
MAVASVAAVVEEHRDGRATAFALNQPGDAGLAHQPFDALASHADAVLQPQVGVILGDPYTLRLAAQISRTFSVSHASLSARSLGARRSHS